jgi:hypothetical protein
MNNPLRRLGQLPWVRLFLIALLTMFWASVIELILRFSMAYVALIRQTLDLLFTPPLNVLISLAIALGVGALAVMFLEIVYPQLIINSSVLWALLLCLFLVVLLRSILPFPSLLLAPSSLMLVGNMLGVFLKGRIYWR